MKHLLWLALLLPIFAQAQNTNGTLQRQIASPNAITGVFGATRDTLAKKSDIPVVYPVLSPSITVTDLTTYRAFPSLIKLSNGSLLTVYRDASTHISSDGAIKGKFSTNNGKTWGGEITILSIPGENVSPGGLKLLANGNILMTYTHSTGSFSTYVVKTVLLNSSGTIISTPVSIGGFTGGHDTFGQIVQLPNGNILFSAYGEDSGNMKVKAFRSTDNASSWTVLSTLATTSGTGLDTYYNETSLFLMPSGNIVASIRHEETSQIAFSKSTDSGSTWSTVSDKFSGLSTAQMILSDGKLMVNYRLVSPEVVGNQSGLRYSLDEGDTWSDAYSVTAIYDTDFMYGGMVPIGDQIGYVYALETDTDISNIHFKYLDATISTGDIEGLNVKGFVNNGDLYQSDNIWFGKSGDKKIGVNLDFTYSDKISLGAGKGLNGAFGGEFASYGLAHATKPGWQGVNLPTGAGSKFAINSNGIGTGTDIFTVDQATGNTIGTGTATFSSLIKQDGTSSQFLKADGSVDENTYLTTSSASSTYLPLSGGTLTGTLGGTSAMFSDSFGLGTISPKTFAGFHYITVDGLIGSALTLRVSGTEEGEIFATTTGLNYQSESHTFSGPVSLGSGSTAVTQSSNDNSTKVATTAYVDNAVSTGSTGGTYTPTITNVLNVTSSTVGACRYTRNGNIVTIYGRIQPTFTTNSSTSTIRFSLPIASDFTLSTDGSGQAYSPLAGGSNATLEQQVATNDIAMSWVSTATSTTADFYFSVSYLIK